LLGLSQILVDLATGPDVTVSFRETDCAGENFCGFHRVP
jgi:hypothetical protein